MTHTIGICVYEHMIMSHSRVDSMMREVKESERLCEEAFLAFKKMQGEILIPSVDMRVSYSGLIGTKLEALYLPNAIYALINSVQLLRNSSQADLLMTE